MSYVLPLILNIVNKSFKSDRIPDGLKVAVISPIVKKAGLDINDLKNYCLVSNLMFLAKVLGK